MALIECPECAWEVSDTASACPKCAYRLGAGQPAVSHPRAVSVSTKHSWWPAASIVGRVGLGGILILLARVEQELGLGTGLLGLIVAGSAIPTWIRHKMEEARVGQIDTAPVDGLEDRIADLEYRHAELEQRQLEQITDLEERIEFAERLLTKQREEIGPG